MHRGSILASKGVNRLNVHGNTAGLKSNQRQRLSRLYDRKVPRAQIVSSPLAGTLCELSAEIGRQVGITLDRAGRVQHVIVGDAHGLFLPDFGRARAGRSRFRGIRLVHTHLRDEPLTRDDLTDLARLRLDLMVALGVGPEGRPGHLYHTHLLPAGYPEPYAAPTEGWLHDDDLDFSAFIEALEVEFGRASVGATETEGLARAVAVHVAVSGRGGTPSEPKAHLRELVELAETAGVVVVDSLVQRRRAYDPKYLMGRGKLDELLLRTMQLDCELVIVDQDLTPNQVRHLAEATDVKVIDRTQLILDIFARRAQTREGKLQVELAQLKYALPRLAHKTDAYSRLMGGIGGRGPGETKLEVDRRRARDRIHRIEKLLRQVATQRSTRRQRRQSRKVPAVAIVGYTNAGKSTLFNQMTQSDVLVENKLFATLDTTSRRLRFPRDREVVISDTVGFIRDLPKDLMPAFVATLEELRDADLLLHVADASDRRLEAKLGSVARILRELGVADRPQIRVFNKIDRLTAEVAENLCRLHGAMGICALDRRTTRPLMQAIDDRVWATAATGDPKGDAIHSPGTEFTGPPRDGR